jgi:hypothetical protein
MAIGLGQEGAVKYQHDETFIIPSESDLRPWALRVALRAAFSTLILP